MAIEDMPDWAKCCDEYIAATQKIGEVTVDLSTLHDEFFNGCGFCFTRNPGMRKRVMDIADGLYLSLETFDLDEGEVLVAGNREEA